MAENTTATHVFPLAKPSKNLSEQRIAVVGAGPAGLSVLCAFAQQSTKDENDNDTRIPHIACFERQSDIGGQWNTSKWRTGLDSNGEPVHSGMYQQLWSNSPKECLEFANYTFAHHFGKNIPSYPPREALLDYLRGRANQFNVKKWIQFETSVRRVTWDDETQVFTVVSHNLSTQHESVQEFDYVFCCTGHFHVPRVPSFPGFETFQGRILHSHDIRNFASEFRDKKLLIVGSSDSAEDVTVQAYKFGCRDITLSWRTCPMPFNWPNSIETKPLLTEIVDGKTAKFKDGSSKEGLDVIVLATGYLHSFPFMEEKLRLRTSNRLWINSLYKGIFFKSNPRLMYMAMHDQWLTFNMFDAQAWYARDVILGRININHDISVDLAYWRKREAGLSDNESMIRYQMEYTADLVDAIANEDYPSWDYELTIQTFLDWERAKHRDIFGYRNCSHKSAFTGMQAPTPSVEWKENQDDSLQAFLELG